MSESHEIKTILHLSDTHGAHGRLTDLPEADIIVHSGDVGMKGTKYEIDDFLSWFFNLPYRYKLYVRGNHDKCLFDVQTLEGLPGNCFFLSNSGVTIQGLKIFGVPSFKEVPFDLKTACLMMNIPADTDILISHQPPYGILDFAANRRFGSPSLLKRIAIVRPKIHLFGHIHDSYGHCEIGATAFFNSALMDESYRLVNPPQLIDVRSINP